MSSPELSNLSSLKESANEATRTFIRAVVAHAKGMTFDGLTACIDGDKTDEFIAIEVHSCDGESFEITGGTQGVSFDGRSSDFPLHLEAIVATAVLNHLRGEN